jgi:hypothetical protein
MIMTDKTKGLTVAALIGISTYACIGFGLRACLSEAATPMSVSLDISVPESGSAVGVVAPPDRGSTPHRDQHADMSNDPMRAFFSALAVVESNTNDAAIGDGGKSIGRYQIGLLYWRDSRVSGVYRDVLNPAYAERVMLAYWRRWCPDAIDSLDFETLARVHNGGPRGSTKQATLSYWSRVREQLQKGSE